MNRAGFATPLVLAAALAGCASTLSGVGGTERYACKAPEGALCTSVSGVYANSIHSMPVSAKPAEKKPAPDAPAEYAEISIAPLKPPATQSTSIRSNPRVLRLWVAPWEDADGDLHEEALVHVVVDTGRWLIEHVRPAARSRVEGVSPPTSPAERSPAGSPPSAKAPSDSPQPPARLPLAPATLSSGPQPATKGR